MNQIISPSSTKPIMLLRDKRNKLVNKEKEAYARMSIDVTISADLNNFSQSKKFVCFICGISSLRIKAIYQFKQRYVRRVTNLLPKIDKLLDYTNNDDLIKSNIKLTRSPSEAWMNLETSLTTKHLQQKQVYFL